MNEAPRCREIKDSVFRDLTNLQLLVLGLSGLRAEDYINSAIKKLESAWEDLLVGERLIK
jgi:hypothetical protein